MQVRLDKDLHAELRSQLRRDGLVWAALPTMLQLRYLTPYLDRQLIREMPVLAAAGCLP